jgi:hypothetical protein
MEKSRTEIERTLVRYGATGFHYAWDRREQVTPPTAHRDYCAGRQGKPCTYGCPKTITREVVIIGFKMTPAGTERRVQLEVPMPHELEVGTKAKAEAATRQRWRALVLVLKAKLEAVASGISTLEAEFMANVVMANGQTLGAAILPRLTEACDTGRLLPAKSDA